MNCAPFDPCLLFKRTGTTLTGIIRLATDDDIDTGTKTFEEQEAKANQRFTKTKNQTFLSFFYVLLLTDIRTDSN